MACKVVVIGAGPGGYVAALRAATLGASVVLVEKQQLGGVCLNRGCIPTKTWLSSVELREEFLHARAMGVIVPEARVDVSAVRERKQRVIAQLVGSIKGLLARQGVLIKNGMGTFASGNAVRVLDPSGREETIVFDRCIIASGSRPAIPPISGIDKHFVLSGEEVFDMTEVPTRVAIVGGGVMGVELAYLYRALGSQVTVVEVLDRLLPQADVDVSTAIADALKAKGVVVLTNSRVLSVENGTGASCQVVIQAGQRELQVECEKVIVAAGRKPNTEDLGLETAGVITRNGWVKVNEQMRTSNPAVYAAGDVTGGPLLAHVASAGGIVAAENACGRRSSLDSRYVPSCVYTVPEAAWVGLTETEAKQKFSKVRCGKYPMGGSGRALAMGKAAGFVKVIAEEKYGEIVGVHMVGPNVTEIIGAAVTAMRLECTVELLGEIMFPHPTVSEALMEAAKMAAGTSPLLAHGKA
ncbi:MAG: dihydrolipoyl dehydrogenase [Bacillota bacterium]